MSVWSRKTLQSLFLPGGVLLLGVVLLDSLGWMTLAPPALSFLYYCGVLGGLWLAWRFHSARIFFALCVLLLCDEVVALLGAGQGHGLSAASVVVLRTVAVLVPLNYILIGLTQERGFTPAAAAPFALLVFMEAVITSVLYRNAEMIPAAPLHRQHLATTVALPNYALILFAFAEVFLLVRFFLTRRPVDGALFWSLAAFFLHLHFVPAARVASLYSATAVWVLAIAIIENSYLLAYHDELTTLPSRRAFNDALPGLHHPYSIAVVDIDHFKQFNDTYGHDTGDQVLRLVAANLSGVTGGGQAYRCGGEEFMILFPGKTTSETVDHLERLRRVIESSQFRMRSGERRRVPRGPDRRSQSNSLRPRKKGHAIRQLAQQESVKTLSVTVSIGVASSDADKSNPELVLQSADKALYRAKAGGRNRIESSSSRRHTKTKAAGIA